MPPPHQELAESLAQLEKRQTGGKRVFTSDELSRAHRERLLRAGFLQQIVRGWLIASTSGQCAWGNHSWFASFWEFCARAIRR